MNTQLKAMKKTGLLLLFLWAFIQIQAIHFRHIGMKEGLSQLSVMAIYQDKLGRMWFGTEEGLSIYDGVNTIAYKPADYKTSGNFIIGNKIHYITDDREGNVYFNADNTLIRYDIFSQQFSCLRQSGIHALYSYKGNLWIGVGDSVNIMDTQTGEMEFFCKLSTPKQFASAICIDSSQRCWIGTNTGLYLKEKNKPLKCIIPHYEIPNIFEDSKGNIWISTRMNGMFMRTPDGNMKHFLHSSVSYRSVYNPIGYISKSTNQLASNQVRNFAEDNYGNIWIGTFQGLNKYNPHNEEFTVYTHNNRPGSISHSSVFPVYKDRQGSIWLGTYYGGVNYFNPEADLFTFYSADITRDDCLSYPFVGHMVEDKEGNAWIATEGGGLNFFDRQTKKFTHYLMNENGNSVAHNNVKNLLYDAEHDKLYIGTHTGGLSIYDMRTKKFHNPFLQNDRYAEEIGDRIAGMELWGDTLVFTTQRGLWKMNVKTYEATAYFSSKKQYGTTCFLTDSKGYIWVAAGRGIYRLNSKDDKEHCYYKYDEKGLGHFPVIRLLEDKKGRIFLGTNGSGLYYFDEENDCFIGYNTQNSDIAGDYCYDIVQFTQGQLLISSDKGLTFFDPDKQEFKVVELGQALPLNGINAGCGVLVCRNGEIFVGGTNGVTTFFEQQLMNQGKEYQLYFSELYINNEIVRPNDKTQVLQRALPYTQHLELRHNQNDIAVRFATNNYITPLQRPVYEYQLKGFDEQWIQSPYGKIHYTNLSPGKYTLIVREKKQNITHQPRSIEMAFVIHPPFYATPLFYLLYIITAFSIIYSIFRFKQSQFRLKTSLEMEKKEKERIEELNQAKLQFFANISHEFRTPLTLIISQLELVMQGSSLTPPIYNKLKKVYRNTYHLRNLISELLDFRKLEQGHVKLKVSELDIVPFLEEIYLTFADYAATRPINYHFNPQQASIHCWFDPKQMEKVVYNLLSNAFKYTKAQGNIELNVSEEEDAVLIKVIDNGIGIKKEDINQIFDRFYQAGNGIADIARTPSTGIGLALVKNVTELHHGIVKVESTPGYGTIFIVRLQKGRAHFTDEECVETLAENGLIYSYEPLQEIPEDMKEATPDNDVSETEQDEEQCRHSVLLVEDNEELLQILKALFEPTYRVILATNGQEGLDKVREETPDIVVSDIMMPEMSGTEMCTRIKNDFNICHIPVVLLTALGSAEQSITGLKLGADDYIGKPFNASVLLARCNNLVRNRRMLQKKFHKEEECDSHLLATNPIDQKFLDTVNGIIEKNLDNSEFDIDVLARELALSRSSFYAKFKALVGMTPNDFVLNYKMKRAATWLRNNPEMQIAEITYKLGFSSPRYFTRCFKAQFNLVPTEYRKQAEKSKTI